jgi:hypothetical protein
LRNASVRAIALTRFRAFRCLSALLNAPADSVGQRDLNWRGVAWRGVAWRGVWRVVMAARVLIALRRRQRKLLDYRTYLLRLLSQMPRR